MKITALHQGQHILALAEGNPGEIASAADAMNLMAQAMYEMGSSHILMEKALLSPAFYDLKTGLAGEILQKYTNYQIKLAIYGDFSNIKSKPLRDFIYESNCGQSFYFVETQQEAIARLTAL